MVFIRSLGLRALDEVFTRGLAFGRTSNTLETMLKAFPARLAMIVFTREIRAF
jgi:hypothetical protein